METNPDSRLPQSKNRGPATGAIIALVLVAALGNVGGILFFWDIGRGPISEFMLCMGIGLLIAQPCSLAIWCALGTQNFAVRVPLTMGILFCLVFIFVGTFFVLENSAPLELPIIIVIGTFALASLVQLPLWLFRLKTGYAISRSEKSIGSDEASQFGIKHLMITTTIAAVIAAISQNVFKPSKLEGDVPWGEIIGFIVSFELFISMVTLLCVAFVYSKANRIGVGIVLGIVVIAGPVGVRFVVNSFMRGSSPGMLANIYGFTFSLTTAILVVLFAFYAMGYRLQRPNA